MAVFGQKKIAVVTVLGAQLEQTGPVLSLKDWCWAVCWLDRDTLSVALAHNSVQLWHRSDEASPFLAVAEQQSAVHCMIYSAKLYRQPSHSDVICLSGTLGFTTLLFWKELLAPRLPPSLLKP